jgi:tetratricopeptide (TPR) repeat protein
MDDDPDAADRDHEFSSGQGFSEPYEGFDLDPEFDVDPDQVDPVDSRVLADLLDERQLPADQVDADKLVDVGVSYTRINRYEQATETFERAARFAEDPRLEQEAWANKGAAHAELEEYDAAIGAYREALDLDPEGEHAATAHTNLAYALWESGQDERALEHAERAVEVDPRFGEGWYNRGYFLLERGLAEDALNAFENAVRLGMRTATVFEEKARAHEQLDQEEAAEEAAERAREIREEAEQQLVE